MYAMVEESPWWRPEFKSDAGWAVVEILRAQMQSQFGGNDEDLARRKQLAEVERLEHQRNSEALKEWELSRQKAESQGQILPADVYAEFIRELLGMIRMRLEDLSERVASEVPPEVRKWIHVPEPEQKSEMDAAPVQRHVATFIRDIEEWLNTDPEEESGDD